MENAERQSLIKKAASAVVTPTNREGEAWERGQLSVERSNVCISWTSRSLSLFHALGTLFTSA